MEKLFTGTKHVKYNDSIYIRYSILKSEQFSQLEFIIIFEMWT